MLSSGNDFTFYMTGLEHVCVKRYEKKPFTLNWQHKREKNDLSFLYFLFLMLVNHAYSMCSSPMMAKMLMKNKLEDGDY